MTILSRQSIIKYMNRTNDPLQVYDADKSPSINEDQMGPASINLSIGNKILELDINKFIQERETNPLDRISYMAFRGMNVTRDRKEIEKSTRTLDLSQINKYDIEEEGRGEKKTYSWKVSEDDYQYRTRIILEDGEATGFMLHTDSYWNNIERVKMAEFYNFMTKALSDITNSLSSLNKGEKIDEKIKKLKFTELVLNKKFRENIYGLPSPSFCDAYTKEHVSIPKDLMGRIDTKSKFARLAVSSHPSSGKVDPGFQNQLALEFKNSADYPIYFYTGEPVAELTLIKLDQPTDLGYQQRNSSLYKKGEIKF